MHDDRISFQKIPFFVNLPDLLDLQKESYQKFLQEEDSEEERQSIGLEGVFKNVFPLEDTHRNYILEYKSYYLAAPKYSPEECIDRGVTYSAPLKVRLILHITDEENRNKYNVSNLCKIAIEKSTNKNIGLD